MGSLRLNSENDQWLRSYGTPNRAIDTIRNLLTSVSNGSCGNSGDVGEICKAVEKLTKRVEKLEDFVWEKSGGHF